MVGSDYNQATSGDITVIYITGIDEGVNNESFGWGDIYLLGCKEGKVGNHATHKCV